MKTLLIAEYRDGKLLANYQELMGFADQLGAECAMFIVGTSEELPDYSGKLYLADVEKYAEYSPAVHKKLILEVVKNEQPDMIVFSHSSYGWDLAPRIAYSLQTAQISEVVDVKGGELVVPVCNSKMRRTIRVKSEQCVVTLQAGAFNPPDDGTGTPQPVNIDTDAQGRISFLGYEEVEPGGVDLGKAEIIVSAGRGIGKPENVEIVADLAQKLGGEYGASRPVVDSEWVDHNRQVGTTGQTVSPKLYVACGISGAIQHLAGMKKSEFVVAINTDRDAPIGEVADVLVVADLKEFIPVLTEKL